MGSAALLLSIAVSTPLWVVPGPSIPPRVDVQPSNNNVSIALHEGRLYMAWRSAPTHFASPLTRLYVISSADEGKSWRYETEVAAGTDVREPHLLSFKGTLSLYFTKLGADPYSFQPGSVWKAARAKDGTWGGPERLPLDGEVVWDVQIHDGKAWMSSYSGDHYAFLKRGEVAIRMRWTVDGERWTEPQEVLRGGDSEAAIAFERRGELWGVTRNEDGDNSGWGSKLLRAASGSPSGWMVEATSPERYDSPKLFEQDGEIYMVARRDVGGPFDRGWSGLPFVLKRAAYMLMYWARPKRTALYLIDRKEKRVAWLRDLPGAGDTAFPSLARLGPRTWLLANYSSPPDMADAAWLTGQRSPRGTGIYLLKLEFTGGK